MGKLDGKVVVLTGAAQGMGEIEARRCAAEGARLVITDLQEERGEALAKELGDDVRFVHQDVSVEADWRRVIAAAVDGFGRLDGLVNNAAIHHVCAIEDESEEALERMLRINVIGSWWGIKLAAPAMRAAGGGSIVNKSSIAGTRGIPLHGSYGASKWAVRGLTKVAAEELGPDGIRVNSVHPGAIEDTGMFAMPDGPERDALLEAVPLRRTGEKREVAGLVVFLLSDDSTYVTGNEHVIDGGRSIW